MLQAIFTNMTKCYNCGVFRSKMRQAQPIIIVFCKVKLAKIKFFTLFLITIRYISQKCITFAADFKNRTKLI